ncbi:hypothetical protein CKF54_07985 [Psittacicella hinzii]|uniref:Hotdog family 3-hydroxylacyl-ACP dehydratase n=1 Tax=Psittacicella hinzii TaxID=2028575 RepID=A0A3A1Y191_9GAMM|nr:dehydratase [Psittacicella hinzii]RIY31046.1 hypothetical protein CKF54_07985 [Psittacicella hinzii]
MPKSFTCPILDVSHLLSQSGKMIQVDQVLEYGDDFIVTSFEIKPDNIFLENDQLDIIYAIEHMAQSIGCWAGCQTLAHGEKVNIGYFLGSRNIQLATNALKVGTKLLTKVKLSIQDASGFGVFDVEMYDAQTQVLLAQASLNVFSPNN